MKKRGKKENIFGNICTLLLAAALCCTTLSAFTNTTIGTSTRNAIHEAGSNQPLSSPASPPNLKILLSENFSDGHMPPTDQPWAIHQTNPSETWYIDNSIPEYPVAKPSASVHRGATNALQDEWLITPSLNFSKYTVAYLQFYWYTEYYVTVWERYVEFNISVSTNGGTTWTKVWSFNDNDTKFFNDWTWYNYFYWNNNNPIDLTNYVIGKNNVKIAFQYYSNHTEETTKQLFSIDDIQVLVNGSGQPLTCNAGGPYEWWWPMQYEYIPPGVRFHGSVNNSTSGVQWLWDFGDGNTSKTHFPIHFYNSIGIFNVTLIVTENKTGRFAIDHTAINLFLLMPPAVLVTAQLISLGIKATIANNGDYNATNVNWTMKISWGPLQIFGKTVANGTCDTIANNSSETIRSRFYFFGFGKLHIIISAYPENIPGVIKHYNALKLGPLVLILKETG